MHQSRLAIVSCALAAVSVACGTTVEYTETNAPTETMTSRSPEDVEVFTTPVPPDRSYEETGIIEARQSSRYSVHSQSGIIAELREKAAKKGCHGIILLSAADVVVGAVSDGSGSVETLKGYRATCILFTGASPGSAGDSGDGAPRATGQVAEAPSGVAGFQFAMTASEARSSCEGAGKEWTQTERMAACSGPAENVGVDGMVQLLPCNDTYCQILVTSEPSERDLISTTTALKKALEKRYGAPSDATTAVPQDCADTVAACLDDQRAYLEYVWTFENGQTVKLRLGKKREFGAERAAADHKLRLLYTRRAPAQKPVDDSTLAL